MPYYRLTLTVRGADPNSIDDMLTRLIDSDWACAGEGEGDDHVCKEPYVLTATYELDELDEEE